MSPGHDTRADVARPRGGLAPHVGAQARIGDRIEQFLDRRRIEMRSHPRIGREHTALNPFGSAWRLVTPSQIAHHRGQEPSTS